MMPDLGTYAGTVLAAYGLGLGLIVGLVAVSLWQARAARVALAAAEQGRDG